MNKNLQKLFEVTQKDTRLILGLMSGTSLDGLDLALCEISGQGAHSQCNVIEFTTWPYPASWKQELLEIFARTDIKFEKLVRLHALWGRRYAEIILDTLSSWQISPSQVDLIASHGQTVFHAPAYLTPQVGHHASLQIVEADHVAHLTGIITISDFRQKHIAAGGQGAPLAVYGDYILFSDELENRLLLNIGGIANATYLPAGHKTDLVWTTDTGPGNTLIDYFTKKYFNLPFDNQGMLARKGRIYQKLIDDLLLNGFFKEKFPKSTGQEAFSPQWIEKGIAQLLIEPEDLLATLTSFTAQSIVQSIEYLMPGHPPLVIYISGGGAHNFFLSELLAQYLPWAQFRDFRELGVDPDAKEAILFALLANEAIVGNPIGLGKNEFRIPGVSMGKISFPN